MSRLIPACAGTTQVSVFIKLDIKAHPRLRGDYFINGGIFDFEKGSSPPARGLPELYFEILLTVRLIPACAGTTRFITTSDSFKKAHPRLRGDYTTSMNGMYRCLGSSPPARGLHTWVNLTLMSCRLIPACAGTTPSSSSVYFLPKAHPRLRGDYSGGVPT